MQFSTTIPMLTAEVENGACRCSLGSRFYHNPPPLPSINVGGSDKASNNITRTNIELRESGVTFFLNQSVSTFFFHECRYLQQK